MSLFQATLIAGVILLAAGGHLAWRAAKTGPLLKRFPRSRTAAFLTLGGATVWFLGVHILNLGAADFGDYKHFLFLGFLAVAIGSFFFVPDFLAVRGAAALTLLTAAVFLNAAYLQEPVARLLLVTATYLAIVIALYLAAVPYRLRDFFNWLFRDDLRPRALGSALAAYGLILIVAAITY